MTLYEDWKYILRHAWSIKFMALSGICEGAKQILPMYAPSIPLYPFSALMFTFTALAIISRMVAQRGM